MDLRGSGGYGHYGLGNSRNKSIKNECLYGGDQCVTGLGVGMEDEEKQCSLGGNHTDMSSNLFYL